MELSGIKINMQGFDARSIEIFRMFFAKECRQNYQITPQQMLAEIIIVDFDTFNDFKIIEKLRVKHPDKPLVVLSKYGYKNNDSLIFSINKPLVYAVFYKLLQQVTLVISKNTSPVVELREALLNHIQNNIRKSHQTSKKYNQAFLSPEELSQIDKIRLSALVGRQANINIENPQAVMRVLFDSKQKLLGSIQRGISRAKHNRKMLELTNFGHRFIIDPKTETIFTFVSESVLRPLCLMSSDEISNIKNIKMGRKDMRFDALTNDPGADVVEWSWDELLWKMTLWTARGKLPKETDLKLPVTLSHWPNFSRLQMYPHVLSIAAVMSQRPIRLCDIASRLGIEQRFVFSFYSAANAIGIANNSRRRSDFIFQTITKEEPTEVTNQSKSFMTKMFSFLTGNNENEKDVHVNKQGEQK